MANAVYPLYMQELLQATAGTSMAGSGTTGVYVALVDTGTYTYSSAHQYFSSVVSAQVGTEVELGTKTFTNGVFDAADTTFTSVSGNSVEALVFFIKTAGANTTWPLLAYEDTGVTGLPVNPNTGDINVTWNNSGIIGFVG